MHGRMHFNHEGYSVTSEKENEKIKTIPRETPRLPASSAPASRMTYCMQVIFSIDFYSLLITSCCYGGRKHWTISQFTGVCLMPQRRRWITQLNFQYFAFVQHETQYVSSEREWSLREGGVGECDLRKQMNLKKKKKENFPNNKHTEPWKKCKWAWLRGLRRPCWVLNSGRFFSINLDYCHYPTCGPKTHRYTQRAECGRLWRSAKQNKLNQGAQQFSLSSVRLT